MLQEMELHKAIKAHTAGKEVLVMSAGSKDGSGQIMVDRLEDYLSGLRFLVEVPATIDPEFAEAVREMENQAPPKTLMERMQELPLTQRNRPASVWVPVVNGPR